LWLLLLTPAWAVERQQLSGHVPEVTARMQAVGRLPASNRLNLAIGLPLRNQKDLEALIEQLYNPASPQYRHYLTPGQFAERFGPSKEDYEALIVFAKACGLTVVATHPNRTLLDVSGSVEAIERAFHVNMQIYQHPTEARTFHAPDVEPSVDLAVRVLHIGGINTLNLPRCFPHNVGANRSRIVPALGGSGPGGGFLGSDFRNAYAPGISLTGAGQAVALVEFDGYYTNDITDYEHLTGLTNVPLQNVLLNGFDGTPGSANGEAALDIEMAISMAPGLSKVLVYEGYYEADVLNQIATDNLARQISCSWFGFGQPVHQIFQQFAAQGQSFFEVSGDFDAYPSSYFGGTPAPVDDPYVTVVGGTELNLSGPQGTWVSETVWNLGYYLRLSYSVGSSGGISPTYLIPSWQQGISMAANHGSTLRRNLPDVAMVADNIWLLADNGDSGVAWGTSAAGPLWAGFSALANELAEANGQPPVGFINPAIYTLAKGSTYGPFFHDVTVGNNNSSSSRTGYPAVPGYDLCTGWGTPTGSNLLYALALPQRLQITPATNLLASGQPGGPFSPTAQSLSLTNSGAASLDWGLSYTAAWLDASATSGTLAPGDQATTVTLTLNSQVNHLPAGSYPVTLWFTNLNDNSVQTRLFTVTALTPPIGSGPVDQTVLEGGTAIFDLGVSPSSYPVTCAWSRDGSFLTDDGHINGSFTATLTISNVTLADAGTYHALVSNAIGVWSSFNAALQVVSSPPVIVVPTTDQNVLPGATASFSVGAIGTPPLAYQWVKNGNDILSGANTSSLTLTNVSLADAGTYSVIVSNGLGSVTNGAVLSVASVAISGVTLTTLYHFKNASDGANPNGLVFATNGLLYGTANLGGANHLGTVFKITTNGVLTTLRAFTGGSDGSTPKAALIQAADGNLYGTAFDGGANSAGTVFRMGVNGGFTTLHAFNWNDGGNPFAPLIQTTDGNFYGTTYNGSTNSYGTVFRMSANGSFVSLHEFTGHDGGNPQAGLAQGNDGNLYGITRNGGANPADGTIFRITSTGALTTLIAGTNSFSPRVGLVLGSDGNFYGSTANDGAHGRGTVFKLTSAGVLTTLHSFDTIVDGQWPGAALVEGKDGYFYGMTLYGGAYGQGTIFRMSLTGQFSTLLHFDGFNGANPAAPLVQAADGSFYGTTMNGGAYGVGTVFRITVPSLTLSIALSGSQIVLAWPSWATEVHLQQASSLATGSWTAVTTQPVVTNLQNQVTVSAPRSGNIFYRLTH
jgi:uncharacterized repeat protein (TIGR03803 family)